MTTNLNALLHPDPLSGMVDRFADQSENRNWISIYEEGEKIDANVDGTFRWDELRYSQDLAPISLQDSPSTGKKKLLQTPKTGSVFVIQEHVDLPMRFLEGVRNPGTEVADAAGKIANEVRELTSKVTATENYWACKSLTTQGGVVNLASFPNSGIKAGSLTYPVLDLDAANTWATAGTKIRSAEINAMKKAYFQANGFKARRAMGTSKVDQYLTANTEISNFFSGQREAGRIAARSFEEMRSSNDMVGRLGGIDWALAEDYYALDSAKDTAVDVVADGDVFALLPGRERSQQVFAIARGVNYVPTGQVAGQIMGATGLLRAVRGRGAFVELMQGGRGLRLYVFSSICLVQKMPKAVAAFDMTP